MRPEEVVGKPAFEWSMLGVITANAAVMGAQTYVDGYDDVFGVVNTAFLGVYSVELGLRLAAAKWRPREFAKDKWNLFDAGVVAVSMVPAVRETVMLLRLARLARVVKIMRYLPDLRIAINAVAKSMPGVASLAAGTALIVFLYGMVGVMLFGAADPEQFGNIGQAMLTMFMLLTLENLPDIVRGGMEITPWAVPFFVSYALLGAFLIFNMFIGIVLNAMEKARDEDGAGKAVTEDEQLIVKLAAARQAIEEAETLLGYAYGLDGR